MNKIKIIFKIIQPIFAYFIFFLYLCAKFHELCEHFFSQDSFGYWY